ncbi:TPA: hypothetical protein IAA82_08425 [Candidatus Galligastranaerophilus gallistercoris]|nr:hypothetical protein [Candidatus Galligastranaerophilus gallistercoris]
MVNEHLSVVDKLLFAVNQTGDFTFDEDIINKAFKGINRAFMKKWLGGIMPSELLTKNLKESINDIINLSEGGYFYKKFPDKMHSPNYGDKWGRLANYIEINNRYISEMHNERCKNGIFGMIKILPAIPPSAFSFANCIIISQIFPNIFGDGYNKGPFEENSIYGIKLNAGYSENIISYEIQDKISPEEQLRAFNELCWFRGIKTGFRMVISADQIKIARQNEKDENFDWKNPYHQEIFINECVKLANLGFEAMFIDSAKHIGGYDMGNYTGVGALPEYSQMQYILYEIRKRSNMGGLSFVGEKSSDDFSRYKNMGLTAGTDFITGDDFYKVRELSEKIKYSREYAPGVEIENDNYEGGISYEQRLNRVNSALFGYYLASDKLPSFMQTNDIFPLRYDTNTHHIMMTNPSYSTDGTPESHYYNAFAHQDGKNYNKKLGELFAHALQF